MDVVSVVIVVAVAAGIAVVVKFAAFVVAAVESFAVADFGIEFVALSEINK